MGIYIIMAKGFRFEDFNVVVNRSVVGDLVVGSSSSFPSWLLLLVFAAAAAAADKERKCISSACHFPIHILIHFNFNFHFHFHHMSAQTSGSKVFFFSSFFLSSRRSSSIGSSTISSSTRFERSLAPFGRNGPLSGSVTNAGTAV